MKRTRWATVAMIGAILVVATGCPPLEFGDPGPGPPTVSPLVAVGAHHTCAQDGSVFCWGDNSAGQLGNGTTTSSTTPVLVPGISWVSSLSAGGDRTCAIYGVDRNVLCWGDNSTGGLGDGTTTNRSTPTKVEGLIDITKVSVGDTFTCAVQKAGGVVCWGQVPGVDGGMTTTPVPIAGLETANNINVGARHACATVGTSLECFGDNSVGQLGDGTTTSSVAPVVVAGVSNIDGYAAAGDHTCATSSKQSMYWCWGDNSAGQLGDGTTTDSSTPVATTFPSLPFVVGSSGLALGDDFSCATLNQDPYGPASNTTYPSQFGCWGDNDSGQLGDGTTTSRSTFGFGTSAITPFGLAAGGDHACAIVLGAESTPKWHVKCWGGNGSGELGNGSTTSSPTPVEATGAYTKDPPAVKPANPAPIVTFTSSPKVVVAGQPVTFTLHITHPVGLISHDTSIGVDEFVPLPDSWGCGDPNSVTTGTATDLTITFSCTFPADIPIKAWDPGGASLYSFNVNIRAVDSPSFNHEFTFYVRSTDTDTSGPYEVSGSHSPDPVALGQPFVFSETYHVTHGPITASPIDLGSAEGSCDTPVIDGSAAPLWTFSASCVVTATDQTTIDPSVTVTDEFGFSSFWFWSFDLAS